LNEPTRVIHVCGKKDVKWRPIGKLSVKVSGRTVRHLDIDDGALTAKCVNDFVHGEPEIRRRGDADGALFCCAQQVGAIGARRDCEYRKSAKDCFQPIAHQAPRHADC
jgi:hypothetical protein